VLYALLLAQTSTGGDPSSWLGFLGPFVPFGGLALWIIISQQRQIQARDARIKELSDQVVDQGQAVVPVLVKATRALEDTAKALERSAGR
jgi:hypothetical protein